MCVIIISACSTVPDKDVTAMDSRPRDLLIVDCLLPPQVRQLGENTTYLGPRRPLRTSGARCAMQGGEYVAYARADFKTALAVWLPQAERGDPQAQTYVGEIYEKGLGTRASYEVAALWYERAAQQNYSRAQINLGYLYESGLGVKRDLAKALNLYRSASGFTAADLEFVSSVEIAKREEATLNTERLQSEVLMLQESIVQGRQALQIKNKKLQTTQQEIRRLRRHLQSTLNDAPLAVNGPAALRSAVKHGERQEIQQATTSEEQLLEGKVTSKAEVAQSDTIGKQLRIDLAAREQELTNQKNELMQLREELSQKQARLPPDAIERTTEVVAKGPIINIIDPPVLTTRGSSRLTINSNGTTNLIGKVEPVDSLYAFRINGNDLALTDTGLFRYGTRRSAPDTLNLLAIDDEGETTRLAISVAQQPERPERAVQNLNDAAHTALMPKISINRNDFGAYHALIIGNDSYDSMNNLKTAANDAMAIDNVLRERYGFSTTLLINATQKTLLGAMERMRETLKPNDNLVIYYAGHGELDTQSGRGYWLPTDAGTSNKDKWIANSAITSMIDLMAAKHVLIIADSCYSGTLTRSSVARALPETDDDLRKRWLQAVSKARVRAVLTSGSIRPVLDGSPGFKHSIFAKKLIDALETNVDILEAYELFFQLQPAVASAAAKLNVQQTPQYAPIRHAGHQAGEFIFLPSTQTSVRSGRSRSPISR